MGVNIKGRSYLKLLDYTSEEIRYLLDLSKQFKNMKEMVYLTNIWRTRTLFFCLKRPPHVPAVPLRWLEEIWAWG